MAFLKDKVSCPVCKSYLGDRYRDEIFVGHCKECRATFTYKPKKTVPTALLDKDRKEGCGCGTCDR